MSQSESEKYGVTNRCDQPVELHLGERVVVLTPYGTAEIEERESESPQLQALAHQRLITLEKSEPNDDRAPPKKRGSRSERTRKKAATKTKRRRDPSAG